MSKPSVSVRTCQISPYQFALVYTNNVILIVPVNTNWFFIHFIAGSLSAYYRYQYCIDTLHPGGKMVWGLVWVLKTLLGDL